MIFAQRQYCLRMHFSESILDIQQDCISFAGFWFTRFLMRNQLLIFLKFSCMWWVTSLMLIYQILQINLIWHLSLLIIFFPRSAVEPHWVSYFSYCTCELQTFYLSLLASLSLLIIPIWLGIIFMFFLSYLDILFTLVFWRYLK